VKILGWYDKDKERWPDDIGVEPPAAGTFQLLQNEKSPTRRAVERWLRHKDHAPKAANQRNPLNASDESLDDDVEYSFPEGKVVEVRHKRRERNRELVRRAKQLALQTHRRLFCAACGFDFKRKYGSLGDGYIECHHTLPLAELKTNRGTKLKDVALLCSNCHRIVHRRRPWLGMKELSRLLAGK
jgi:predicted HNH restriction endonuclease